ncbi:hypothetical protein CEP52_017553 [Fusarium oligoseptatum]|uniref:Chromo shadow domain-containing protein n=1 Tax=Fusarium oligoseptatum TaxID=2604345 RepID=A0A428RNW2_9HYPO|nr:hypothetical protein CEP52_017553 [Fusarium oligoseptatum]
MKTRSQKRASGKASLRPNRIRRKHSTKQEDYKWESLEIDRVELEELTGSFIVVVKWPNGDVSQHDKVEIYNKSPRKMLKFYERHIQFVDREEAEK